MRFNDLLRQGAAASKESVWGVRCAMELFDMKGGAGLRRREEACV